jgi:hypothetical protein
MFLDAGDPVPITKCNVTVENASVAQATQGFGQLFKQANCGLMGMGATFLDDPCGCTWIVVEKLIHVVIVMYSVLHVGNTITSRLVMCTMPEGIIR